MPKQKIVLCAAVSLFIFLIAKNSLAAPSVSNISGTVSHGSQITISGTEFGLKSLARPLIWDDAETAINDTAPSTSVPPNGYSRVPYSQVLPPTTLDAAWETRYRNFPITPEGESGPLTSVSAPHSNSTRGISGGHQNGIGSDGNDGTAVMLTVAHPSGQGNFASDWYMSYYLRYNPDWAACSTSNNHKFLTIQSGTQAFSNTPYTNQYLYFDYSASDTNPCADSGYVSLEAQTKTGIIESVDHSKIMPDTNTPWDKIMGVRLPRTQNDSPKDGWVKVEIQVSDTTGFVKITFNGMNAWWGSNQPYFFTSGIGYHGIGSVSIGSFFRQTLDVEENDNNHNFFDDIYVDYTFSRVVLANNQNYDQATITEPQIPSAWNGNSISSDVNLGKLPDSGTVYLFVFDADGNHNATGYPVIIGSGSGDTIAPNAPSGLSVR